MVFGERSLPSGYRTVSSPPGSSLVPWPAFCLDQTLFCFVVFLRFHLFLEKRGRKEKERERNINV